MLQTAFRPSCMNRASVFKWHRRLKKGMEYVRDDERCGRSKEVNTPELISQRLGLGFGLLCWGFKGVHEEITSEDASTLQIGQWHFYQDNAPDQNSILVTDYLTKMGIKTFPHRPWVSDLASCDIWLFPKLRGCHSETIEKIKEAGTKVIDTLTQEDFHGAFCCWKGTASA